MRPDRRRRTHDPLRVNEYLWLSTGHRQHAGRACHRFSGIAGSQDDQDPGGVHLVPGTASDGSGDVRLPDDTILAALPGILFGADFHALPVPAEVQLDDLSGDHHRDGGRCDAAHPAVSELFF